MCVVSMIGDHFHDKWKDYINTPTPNPLAPLTQPYPNPWGFPNNNSQNSSQVFPTLATKQELDELKKEVLEMKELLKKAIEYDKKNNEPHCEVEEKIATLKKIAEMVGVSLEDIFKENK